MDKLKQPFWFGLPVYAWVAGAVALVAGVAYFGFFAKAGGSNTDQTSDPTASDDGTYPYPTGVGAVVPPAPAFDNNSFRFIGPPTRTDTFMQPQPVTTPTAALVVNTGRTRATSAPAPVYLSSGGTSLGVKRAGPGLVAAANRLADRIKAVATGTPPHQRMGGPQA